MFHKQYTQQGLAFKTLLTSDLFKNTKRCAHFSSFISSICARIPRLLSSIQFHHYFTLLPSPYPAYMTLIPCFPAI